MSARRRGLLQHAFRVGRSGDSETVVSRPADPWSGDLDKLAETFVDLECLADLAESVRERILRLHAEDRLDLALDAKEVQRRYIFCHPVSADEWQAQQAADQSG